MTTTQLDERQFTALKEVATFWKWCRAEDAENIPRWIEEQARKSRQSKLLFAPITSANSRTAWLLGTPDNPRPWRPTRHLLGLEAALAALRCPGAAVRAEEFVTDPTASAPANTCRNSIERAAKKLEQAGFKAHADVLREIVVTATGEVFYPGGSRVEIVTSWP
jgi:hypothetical protein